MVTPMSPLAEDGTSSHQLTHHNNYLLILFVLNVLYYYYNISTVLFL